MKRSFMIAVALLITMCAAAQMTKEVYVGYSRVMDEYEIPQLGGNNIAGTGYGNGVEAGINLIRPITKPLALTFGIQALYGWDDEIEDLTNIRVTDQFIKFHVPVRLLCETRPLNKDFAIEYFAGLNCSFYAFGKCKWGGKTYDWFDGKDALELNRVQFGWHIGANLVYKRYFLTMNYQRDITKASDNSSTHWANIEFRLGYRF